MAGLDPDKRPLGDSKHPSDPKYPSDPKHVVRVVAAVVEQQGRYLITQRRASAIMPLLWEFPGGRVEPGESDQEALKREVFHRLEVRLDVGKLMSFVSHKYDRYTVDLHLYECRIADGQPCATNVHAFAWVESEDFDRYPFTPADEASVAELLGL
jgi:8-oxo-dGTP diphosphatase